jgi:phage tail tape-measure protein
LEAQNSTSEEAKQQQKDALRQQVQRDIEAARFQIEAALALLNAHPNREELASQITALQSQLMQLDGLRMEASTGNMTQLAALQVGVTISVGAAQNLTSHVASATVVESFQSVMVMSHEQMAVLEQHHWQQTQYFRDCCINCMFTYACRVSSRFMLRVRIVDG